MSEQSQNSDMHTARRSIFRQDERITLRQVAPGWRRFLSDSLLALTVVALVTAFIAIVHLYPRLPSIILIYLLAIIALASTRGRYAAILASVLASISFDFFFTPPLYEFTFTDLGADDLLDPWVFLATAVIASQLTAALRSRAEQPRRKEQETRQFLEQAQELATLKERQRLARELHDSVSQALYGISLGAHTAREALASDPGEAFAPLEYVIALTDASLAEMRTLIFELRPEFLATEGITAALTKQVAILRARYKLSVEAQLGEEPPLSLEEKQALYHIAREALHNIVKHAAASTVTLRLTRQDGELILEICDDGKGFDPKQPFSGHLGLSTMQEHVALLHGTHSLESAPGQGTCLRVRIPIHDETERVGSQALTSAPPREI